MQQNKPTLKYWQALEELQDSPEVLEAKGHEFKQGVTDDFDPSEMGAVSRRRFLAAMGASAAFALTSCKSYMDHGKVVPYNHQTEEVIVGRPTFFASAVRTRDAACSVLVRTREGRPINLAGNPENPFNQGHINSQFLASVTALYDPERLSKPHKPDGSKLSWQEADDAIRKALQGDKQVALIAHSILSPAFSQLLKDFQAHYSNVKVYTHNTFHDGMRQAAWKKSYGQGVFPALQWDQADVVLALESDFLGVEGDLEMARLFADRRDIMNKASFNRFYVAEGNLSQTGMNADYRLRLRPDAQYSLVMGLLNELGSSLSSMTLASVAKAHGLSEAVLKHLVEDLKNSHGKALVYAGDRLPEAVHIAVNALNDHLGASALYRQESSVAQLEGSSVQDWEKLVSDMKSGAVGAVLHLGSNPVFELPTDLGYAEAVAKVPLIATLGTQVSETTAKSTHVLPVHHDLESWGDFKSRTGLHLLQQPVIRPIHDSRQAEGLFLAWLKGESYSEDLYLHYLQDYWQKQVYTKVKPLADFKTFWNSALHDGFVQYAEPVAKPGAFKASALKEAQAPETGKDFVVLLGRSYAVGGDGEFAGNGWLQEIPHPVSKVVWSNYAAISVTAANELGIKTDDLVQVQVGNRTLELPALVQPGMADKVIAIELGYGRSVAGMIGSEVGFNAHQLLSKADQNNPWILKGALSKGNGKKHLVCTQLHHAFDLEREQDLHIKRGIVHEANYPEYVKDPHSAAMHTHHLINVTKMHTYEGVKWAMAIDANKCTGCGTCVMACNVENNVPVVGPEQVDKGREMHWMRLDRYYSGTPEEPTVSIQPMLCQHCDNAPCEVVCPVNATNHSPDGLNQMAYNRCVGTRYCSNNCPYKVRRFNFFDYRNRFAKAYYRQEVHQLQHNPEVTVRSRGVMEKCTFCVQRLMWARQEAIREKRALKGSDVTTACQESCPSHAIVFGDMNDSESPIMKYRKHVTGYHVLEEVNARPNVTYVAKLRNTHDHRNTHA
ncbi:molybdopterin oxidoreductase [bacterium (Candidatus Blackallbacteria) CG17_big_fil_post_rev_8_21_14_2_50_48_46]|uniref:Molybdopterin oxidoreductase n=1 Tax=bacterium (Candidatus Blackallbacteria) CG17_big_fil_post_rev_8_21_14_2_50_48_46 TaxID=2014261 RepID=A0A2M7G566_9BACT|nr:MAG: molybdopterin oxidoreductase [bacterium (Candidatus Blackallbacteria) CG18_big_fil_WC_8_21_14_2_50_49_26]PIW17070.1 MAG: molybdopterin oxidoreductase [bacterium (Candidatus Blackallbacteria) CG17_big_fil_post_rev_8_21_14_2_50_48_46]PIW47695.1 MAG: molybdopterin oxidoreductase [bacterium (Candidatus Blackallbacteria) CG13_big_fil_rev_8_21_14_2_50_49_14]